MALPAGWNREHLWPNSLWIDKKGPAYSDLHNLRPADATVNSARGNKLFDVSDTNDRKYKHPAHNEAPDTTEDTDSWEPPPEVRGNIARAVFYMDVRYEGDKAGEPDLRLTNDLLLVDTEASYFGKLFTLIQWHLTDPVNEVERIRNDLVYSQNYQRNRNPFVDHPEWVVELYGDGEVGSCLLSHPRAEEGVFRFKVDFQKSGNYLVLRSADLKEWSTVDAIMNVSGSLQIEYELSGASGYYRIIWTEREIRP